MGFVNETSLISNLYYQNDVSPLYINQLCVEHKQERPDYIKIHESMFEQPININKVYIIREDDVDISYYVMLLPEEY
ncbi:hypothetical protein FOG26_11785 [Staphylococcus cohnii]|nr:hypothetical protein [Staphylococcus cohnii]MBZ8173826.1 hypothetical protein [Staphylococcus cohnii]